MDITNGINSDFEDTKQREFFEKEIEKKELILNAIHYLIQELSRNHNHIDAIDKILSLMGNATNVSRVYYFENKYDAEVNGWFTSQKAEWCSINTEPQIFNLELQNIPFEAIQDFISDLSSNIIINSLVKDMEEGVTKQLLIEQNIVSIIILPIFVRDVFWGFVGFDDCINEKKWSNTETSLLEMFSISLSRAIEAEIFIKELQQSKQNFDNFFNTIKDMLFVLDKQGIILYANNTVYKRLGYLNSEEVIGKSVLEMHPAHRREEVLNIITGMLAGNRENCFVPVITKQNKEIAVETFVVEGMWNGLPVLFGVTKDISDLKRSEEKFAKTFHTGNILMAISKIEDGTLIDVNNVFLTTLGYKRDELIGKKTSELGLFVNSEIRNSLSRRFSAGERDISDIETEVRTKEGKVITGIFSFSLLEIDDLSCWLTSMKDISERKEFERALINAKEDAEKANKIKGHFLSTISHEIRTPMNSVIAYSNLLNDTELNYKQKDYINKVIYSSNILLELINDVLDYEKIQGGLILLDLKPFDFYYVLNFIIDQYRSLNRKIAISVIKDDLLPTLVLGDSLRFQQVVLNLLDNAIKFTNQGEIIVEIKLIKDLPNQLLLEFSISDTGIGMTEKQLELVFEPFIQGSVEVNKNYGGTGLGLSIAKHLVQLQNGDIWVESNFGKGSTFFFTILFEKEKGGFSTKEKSISHYSDIQSYKELQGLRVLVVEDNIINQDIYLELLHSVGMNVTILNNGLEAINYVKKENFDIIIMDVRMPVMDGYEATKLIRRNEKSYNTPIIAATADIMDHSRERCLDVGMNDFIAKPINKYELFDKIKVLTQKVKIQPYKSNVDLTHKYSSKSIEEMINTLGTIDDIHLEKALIQLNGNKELLVKILIKFTKYHLNFTGKLQKFIQEMDFHSAKMHIHTFKGVVAGIGANKIHKLTIKLEDSFNKNPHMDLGPFSRAIDESFSNILEVVRNFEININKEYKDKLRPIEMAEVHLLFGQLITLLKNNDIEAIKVSEKIALRMENTMLGKEMIELNTLTEQYRFKESAIFAQKILNNLNKEDDNFI